MNFFQHQEDARKKSTQLVALLFVAVALLVLITAFAISACLFVFESTTTSADISTISVQSFVQYFWNMISSQYMLLIILGVCLVVTAGSLYKARTLRHGGAFVAASLGGKLITRDSRERNERKILNVVEEMAIASGTPIPLVFLLDEPGINAFAAGTSPNDAVIGVTRGAIASLTRDELQGVIAHEFSHIHHGDMRLNMRVLAVLHGVLLIALIGELLLRSGAASNSLSSRRHKKNGQIAILGLVLIGVGFGGLFVGNIIKAAVSRQREFLADASSVQYTRNPFGIAKALVKIKRNHCGSQIRAEHASEYSHFYFADGIRSFWRRIFATHPPVDARIERIVPNGLSVLNEEIQREEKRRAAHTEAEHHRKKSNLNVDSLFDLSDSDTFTDAIVTGAVLSGTQDVSPKQSHNGQEPPKQRSQNSDNTQQFETEQQFPEQPSKQPQEQPTNPFKPDPLKNAIEDAGALNDQDVSEAQQLIHRIPREVHEACHTPFQARAVAYCLLLSQEQSVQDAQIAHLKQRAHPATFKVFTTLYSTVLALHKHYRLPLIQLCLPSLRQLSIPQRQVLLGNIDVLIKADKKISVNEWCIQEMIAGTYDRTRHSRLRYGEINTSKKAVLTLLRFVSYSNGSNTQASSFQKGAHYLFPGKRISMPEAVGIGALNLAFKQLRQLKPLQIPQLLKAIATVIEADNHISQDERDILRTIAYILDCPIPLTQHSGEPIKP